MKNLKNKVAVIVATAATFAAAAANAAIDGSVSTAMNAVQQDAISLSAIVTPIIVAVMGLGIVMKLIKRFGGKL